MKFNSITCQTLPSTSDLLKSNINVNYHVKDLLKLNGAQQNRATVMSLFAVVIFDISTNDYANEHSERDLTSCATLPSTSDLLEI